MALFWVVNGDNLNLGADYWICSINQKIIFKTEVMDRKVKHDIIKMLIPVIGTWWVIKRIVPDFDDITWWDYSKYPITLTLGLVFYQAICWIGYKVFYMMYFFDYEFLEVFTKW